MNIQRSLGGSFALTLALTLGPLTGCDDDAKKPEVAEKTQPVEAKDDQAKQEKKKEVKKPLALGHRFPVGPRLVFLPGKGVGPIRFGATVETIERHMEAPCDEKTEERCIYVRAAVEFFLKDGTLNRIRAHRRDRKVESPPEGKDKYFGSLRGIVQPRIMMGLHRHIVLEEFGEPTKKEPLDPPGDDGLADRHTYEGIVLEYDKIENGNIVLAGIEVVPSDKPYQPPAKKGTLQVPPGGLKGPAPQEERAR